MKLICIMLDALGYSYLSEKYTPNLYKLSKESISLPLEPMFAFEGIMATVLTGRWPETHDVWTRYARRSGKYKANRQILELADWLSNTDETFLRYLPGCIKRTIRARIRDALKPITREPGMPYENGVDFIHTFAYNKLGDLYHINKVPTIFDYLSQSGLKGAYLADKIEVVHKLLCNNKFHNNFDFLLAHTLDELDILAHKEGPKSLKVLAYLKSQDALIVKLLEDIRKTHAPEEIVYLLFSDHGMVEVSNYIDISELTHEASKRNIKFFADSTVFRAWGSNDDLGFIYDFMKHQPDVTCLCEKEKKELKINFDNNIYGDVIFAAEPGSVFLPNFFDGQNKVKGMHGYAGSHQDLLPMLILNGRGFNASGKRGRIQMPDIFATILKLLEIEIPSNCEGEPII